MFAECLILAENCLPPQFTERLLWRKQTPKSSISVAEKRYPHLAPFQIRYKSRLIDTSLEIDLGQFP